MKEFQIQSAWENYKEDFGLGRILLFVTAYNLFLFITALTYFSHFYFYFVLPIIFNFLFIVYRPLILRIKRRKLIFFMFVPMLISIGMNYFLVGEFDRIAGGLERLDPYFIKFEQDYFGGLLGMKLENLLGSMGLFSKFLFEIMMISYVLFYLVPYFGAIRFFLKLKANRKYVVGRLLFSVIIFHSLNYILYLLVPVTGPQHFIPYEYSDPLNFLFIGEFLHQKIHYAQNNYIDCFPSGHLGASLLVTFWMFRIKDPLRFLLLITTTLIAFATLTLRYHYFLDLVFAIPLCFLSYYLGKKLIPIRHNFKDYIDSF